jgi:hypothetical protein
MADGDPKDNALQTNPLELKLAPIPTLTEDVKNKLTKLLLDNPTFKLYMKSGEGETEPDVSVTSDTVFTLDETAKLFTDDAGIEILKSMNGGRRRRSSLRKKRNGKKTAKRGGKRKKNQKSKRRH